MKKKRVVKEKLGIYKSTHMSRYVLGCKDTENA